VRLAEGQRVLPAIGLYRENVWMINYETSVFLDDKRVALNERQPGAMGEVA
jgi:hypothetical protein